MIIKRYSKTALVAALFCSVVLGACSSSDSTPESSEPVPNDEGSGSGDNPENGVRSLIIDATAGGFGASPDDAANKWTYFNFDTGQVVELSDGQADESTEWHMAFKRVGIRVNGGVSGPGEVRAALIDAQLDFYDEEGEPDVGVFTSATADSELAALEQAVDVSALTFASDSFVTGINGDGLDEAASWWLYDPSNNSVNANPDVWSVVRGASGESFARLHVTDIQQTERQVTVEMYVQGSGAESFSDSAVTWTAAIGVNGGALCYDFDELVEVDCAAQSDAWDLQVEVSGGGRSWNLWTNGGVARGDGDQGASFGPLTTQSQAGFSNAAAVPTWFEDEAGGVFETDSWYAYNLQENNRIWPNYRVYGIDTSTAIYKLQIIGYYDEAGASGNISLRFDQVD